MFVNWRVAILPISSMPRNVIIIKLKWHSPLKIQPPKRPAMLNALLLCMKIYHYSFTQSPTYIILYGGLLRTQTIFKQQKKRVKTERQKQTTRTISTIFSTQKLLVFYFHILSVLFANRSVCIAKIHVSL